MIVEPSLTALNLDVLTQDQQRIKIDAPSDENESDLHKSMAAHRRRRHDRRRKPYGMEEKFYLIEEENPERWEVISEDESETFYYRVYNYKMQDSVSLHFPQKGFTLYMAEFDGEIVETRVD